ncbi:MAG: amidohydrolase family protein [Saprospiraceae bacterium]|nr:amidohydrolase family protein [Saprospiraceae bacterium]
MVIDSHQHFWKYDPVRHGWINDEMSILKKDFLPADLAKIYETAGVDGCVAVQADQSESETDFLLQLAEQYEFIKGVVGWVDLRSPELAARLSHYHEFPKLKGFRHVVQSEPDPNFMLREDFQNGIAQLHAYNFTYDILIFPNQFAAAIETVRNFPNQKFVVDHIAKPYIKEGKIKEWTKHMEKIASFPNVMCKLSGMVTEADWSNWKQADFVPYLEVVHRCFTAKRLLFGSDWPVCLLGGSYPEIKAILANYLTDESVEDQAAIWGKNAVHFYQL